MSVLILDDSVIDSIISLAKYAEENPVSMDELLDTVNKQAKPVGDFKEHTLELPFGNRIVYSIEDQPLGKIRHLSMSKGVKGKLPSVEAVRIIMKLLGFKNEIEYDIIFIEEIPGGRQAINVMEVIIT